MMERAREKGLARDDDEGPAGEQDSLLSIKLMRGLAAGKRGGPCTPSPAWKLEEDMEEEEEAAAGVVEGLREAASKRQSVSARRLGANLWEVQDFLPLEGMRRRNGRRHRHRENGEGAELSHLVEEDQVTPYNPAICSGTSLDLKGAIGGEGHSRKTSTELLKVLNRIWSLEEKHVSNVSVVKSLKVELEHARTRIQELMQVQKEHHREMDKLMNQVAEDKVIRTKKEKDRMNAAVQSIREELDDEKRLRKRSESLHHKIGKELSGTKTALSKALEDLENARTSNDLLQNLCDEFARGIGQYEKEMREFKKYTKDCDCKVNGLLFHISEVWLNERLQMQMAESCGKKLENGIISRLKEEIASFLQLRHFSSKNGDGEQRSHHHNLRRQSLESLHLNGTISAPHDVEDDGSTASDLHCFELNMDKSKERTRDQLKSHCDINSSSIEHARKSSSARKIEGIRRAKEESDRQLEGIEVGNTANSQADADSDEAAIFQKWTNSTSVGGHERYAGDMDESCLLTHYTSKNNLKGSIGSKAHHANYQGEISENRSSGRGNFFAASGPMQQWIYRGASVDPEISECSSKLPQGLKENTLKAKLLEARLEGRHARLRALKGA